MWGRLFQNGLTGRYAHTPTVRALEGLDWQLAGEKPEGAPHTIFQLLHHMIYWQDFCLERLKGGKPVMPGHASGSWPGPEAPTSADEWEGAVSHFAFGLEQALAESHKDPAQELEPGRTRGETLSLIMGHNSHHLGQVILLRQMLGSWPPPGGGDTW